MRDWIVVPARLTPTESFRIRTLSCAALAASSRESGALTSTASGAVSVSPLTTAAIAYAMLSFATDALFATADHVTLIGDTVASVSSIVAHDANRDLVAVSSL